MRSSDAVCPACGQVVRGANDFVSVAVFIHQQTPGRCLPTNPSAQALPMPQDGQPGRPDSEVAAAPETRDMKTREGTYMSDIHERTPVEVAAQLWCKPEHAAKEMDTAFAASIAAEIKREQDKSDAWFESAREFCNNATYYRALVERIGRALGPEAFRCDDGTTSEDVLCAKVPELVEELAARMRGLEK